MALVERATNSPNLAIQVKVANGEGEWAEFDGNWTTFLLEVGNDTQNQNFRFVPSTSSFATWLPVSPCYNATLTNGIQGAPSSPTECAVGRGVGLYQGSQSVGFDASDNTTYKKLDLEYFGLGSDLQIEELFGSSYNESGQAGLDYISMTFEGTSTTFMSPARVPILGEATTKFFLPTVGIGFGNWTSHVASHLSFMSTIGDASMIPSFSWGYTAGAQYRNNGVGYKGSLTLGGYDAARFDSKTTGIFQMPPDGDGTELLMQVASIVIDWNDEPQAGYPNSFNAVIDSTLPYLFLPSDLCQWFADRYNLTYDGDPAEGYSGLYYLDEETAGKNQLRTKTITFELADLIYGNVNTTIDFPYDSFNTVASWAWQFPDTTSIFPIRNATSKTAVLGRAFLQEAYVSANYEPRPEGRTFNVSQAAFPNNGQAETVSIIAARNHAKPTKSRLGGGAIAGIVVGVVAALVIAAFALWYFVLRPRRKKKQAEMDEKERENAKVTELSPTQDAGSPSGERRSMVGSAWSDNTLGRSEIDSQTSPNLSHRPSHSRQVSELSSDSEHERRGTSLGILHEMPDKSDAAQLEEIEARVKAVNQTPRSPQEMEGSTDWMDPNRRE